MRNVILIGFMAAGKTSAGKRLAESMNMNFLDLDEQILKTSKYKSITDLFKELGEEHFRILETIELEQCIRQSNYILACGGGTVVSHKNQEILRHSSAIIVHLAVDFETVLTRVKDRTTRPLLSDLEKARHLYNQRQHTYNELANLTITTDSLNVLEVVKIISSKMEYNVN